MQPTVTIFAFQSIFFLFSVSSFILFLLSSFLTTFSGSGFFITFIVSAFFGFIIKFFKTRILYGNAELIISTLIIWCILILLSSIPFYSLNDISLSEVIFIGASLFTTTGFNVNELVNINNHNILFLWQALIQFIGACYSLISYLLFFLLFFKSENISINLSKQRIIKLLFYLTFVLLGYAFIIYLQDVSFYDSFLIASAIFSSGGFIGYNGHFLGAENTESFLISLFTALMILNIFLIPIFLYFDNNKILNKYYKKMFSRIVMISAFFAVLIVYICFSTGLSISQNLFLCFSMITTTGLLPVSITDAYLLKEFRPYLLIFVMFSTFGALSGSVSGGLKLNKISLIFIKMKEELTKILYVHNLKGIEIIKKGSNEEELNSFYSLLAFGCMVSIICILFHTLQGYTFETAFLYTLAALTNTGDGMLILGEIDRSQNNYLYYVLSIMMIIGRFETVGYLLLFKRLLIRV